MRLLLFLTTILLISGVSAEPLKPKSNLQNLPGWWYATPQSFKKPAYWIHSLKEGDTVCVSGHTWKSNGSVKLRLPPVLAQLIKQKRIRLLPLLTPGGYTPTRKFLRSKEARTRFIREIHSELQREQRWQGLHLDMEYIQKSDQETWLHWLSLLRASLLHVPQANHLSMAIFPVHDQRSIRRSMHPPDALSRILDEAVIMAYDYHGPSGNAGPVSDLEWIGQNLRTALDYYTKDQIWLGLPLYGYGWIGTRTVVLARRSGLQSPRLKKYNFDYSWLPSDEFLNKALTIVHSEGLKGAAFWRAGFENESGL